MVFYKVIESSIRIPPGTGTLQDIVFKDLPGRSEKSIVIKAYLKEQIIEITLADFRNLILRLIAILHSKGFKRRETILLLSTTATNELYTALLFSALTVTGIRVLLPMFTEPQQLRNWIEDAGVQAVIMPVNQVKSLKGYEREKEIFSSLKRFCDQLNVRTFDDESDFNLDEIISQVNSSSLLKSLTPGSLPLITSLDEAVIYSTSGTTGKSKLIHYTHGALYKISQHFQSANLFDPVLFGSSCFTPLFTHTIGVRSFINSIWSGHAFCFITVDWIYKEPELATFLLMKMKPGHLIGGPAFFNALVELFRQFPELKQKSKEFFKCFVSIGSAYNHQTAEAIKTSIGLPLFNSFGTTETQVVSFSNAVNGNGYCTLGKPLPGVKMALAATGEQQVYKLYVSSPYQCKNIQGSYFKTGDLVRYDASEESLYYAGRSSLDFIKDDFGVKIPLKCVREYYKPVYDLSEHIEWFPLRNKPGLAALLFCNLESSMELGLLIKNINNHLQQSIQPFEFTHRHLDRVCIINENVPTTRKGTVSKGLIIVRYKQQIEDLQNAFVRKPGIIEIDDPGTNLLYTYVDPQLSELLNALGLNVTYIKGRRDYLFYKTNGIKKQVLDLTGGFGANFLGHSNPRIKKVIIDFVTRDYTSLNNQGSIYHYPSLLAQRLNSIFSERTRKFFRVQLANSGSEAVEMALHHAYLEWKRNFEKLKELQLQIYGSIEEIDVNRIWIQNFERINSAIPAVLTFRQCFHGYSTGARSLLNDKEARTTYSGLLKLTPLIVDDFHCDWKEQLKKYVDDNVFPLDIIIKEEGGYKTCKQYYSRIICSILEPVRGEGGVEVMNPGIPQYLKTFSFPLISDEIQCGLGRTGAFPECDIADYYLLGKSLGGGYEKIAAVLIDDNHFQKKFPKYYTSTFANGDLAARVALETLNIIHKNNLPLLASRKGSFLAHKLASIASRYTKIISSIGGKGLMLGIHFSHGIGERNNIFRVLYSHELLGYLFSAWMFHHYQIRIFPSLSAPNSLRIEPSVYIKKEEMDLFCLALEKLCDLCEKNNLNKLLSFLMKNDGYDDVQLPTWKGKFPNVLEEPAPGAVKVGFISNFTRPVAELKVIEPSLEHCSDTGLRILFNKLQVLFQGKPIKILSKNLLGGRVHFTFYLLPFDTAHLENVNRYGKKSFYISKIQQAVELLSSEGITHVSLGAYASIVTGNGLALASPNGIKILTGNTLTISSCIYHLDKYLKTLQRTYPRIKITLVGASGNIGSGLAKCLMADKYFNQDIVLVGNNKKRLEQLASQNKPERLNQHISTRTDLSSLEDSDIVICCTNTNDPIIFSEQLSKQKPVYIIDISVPAALAQEVYSLSNVIICKEAATVTLKGDPEFLVSSHTDAGKIFCCAGEVILDGLYKTDLDLKGHIKPESINSLYELALKEEFFN